MGGRKPIKKDDTGWGNPSDSYEKGSLDNLRRKQQEAYERKQQVSLKLDKSRMDRDETVKETFEDRVWKEMDRIRDEEAFTRKVYAELNRMEREAAFEKRLLKEMLRLRETELLDEDMDQTARLRIKRKSHGIGGME